jgi:hypothetical protein
MSRMTDGMRTSEFYLTALTLVVVAVLAAFSVDTAEFIDLAKYLVPGYAVARGIKKTSASRDASDGV